MKLLRFIGLVALALSAQVAVAAPAAATEITSSTGSTPTITAEAEKHVKIIGGGFSFGVVTCGVSKITATITTHGAGKSAAGPISLLTFSTCTGGAVTSPVAKPGTLSFTGITPTGDSTVVWSNGEVIIHETAVGKCVFVTNNTDIGRLTGSTTTGGNATLDLNGFFPNNGANPFCGSSAILEGAYKITSPATLNVH